VEATIRLLEGSGLFNAGIGSRLQLDGARRMDASIMEGQDLRAGAVAAIERVRHPITAAKLVMQETNHVLLVGPPASRAARYWRLERQSALKRAARRPPIIGRFLDPPSKKTLHLYRSMRRSLGSETVGAVALDRRGTVAAGASTGGVAVMLPGRVGDTPLIGCGIYADNRAGAVSMTGIGESIIRLAMAKAITERLAAGATPAAATRMALKDLAVVRGSAGALVLDRTGRLAIRHTTSHMAGGYWSGTGSPRVADRFP
jgi:beta-aspartyl-peptidase (threonine type)